MRPDFYTCFVASVIIGFIAYGAFDIGTVRAIGLSGIALIFLAAISAIVHAETQS